MMDAASKVLTYRRFTWLTALWALGVGACLCLAGWGVWAWWPATPWRWLVWLGVLCLALGAFWLVCVIWQKDDPVTPAFRQYMGTFLPAMAGYVLAIFVTSGIDWHGMALWVRALVGLLPVLPMVWVVISMWRYSRDSDELEQRVQREAVYATCGVVGVLAFALGMLESMDVLHIEDGLIFVLPAMFAVYGIAQWWCRRKYGLAGGC